MRSVPVRALMLFGCAGPVLAQQPTRQAVPEPRPLGPIVARSSQTFGAGADLFPARGGVFVNDGASRRLLWFDSTLTAGRTVLDSASGLGRMNYYGPPLFGKAGGNASLSRFRGDSLFFVPAVAMGITGASRAAEGLVIGPDGRVGRVTSVPTGVCSDGTMDNTGWVMCERNLALTRVPPIDMGDSVMTRASADSSAVVSFNPVTGDADTVARITIAPRIQLGFSFKGRGGARSAIMFPVIYLADAWTTFRDGTLAIVRGADYHVDIIDVKGQVTRGPRAPFVWRRVTDDDRDRLVDSLRIADSVEKRFRDSVAARRPPITLADGTVLRPPTPAIQPHTPPDDWPTYWPVLNMRPNSGNERVVMVDADDRIWVDERQPVAGDSITVYGIFDKKGNFLERVKVPASQTVVSFGPGGAVYLATVDGGRSTILRARFR